MKTRYSLCLFAGLAFLVLLWGGNFAWPAEKDPQQPATMEFKKKDKTKERKKEKRKKKAATEEEAEKRREAYLTTYAATEDFLVSREAAAVRRAFITTEPLYYGGRIVEEQRVFENMARREEEILSQMVGAYEEKPWWKDLLGSLSGVTAFEESLYTNYFNTRARHDLWTEKGFFGLRAAKRGVISLDGNYYLTLERPSFERNISFDPHVIKTHGGQMRVLYRPTRRFHLLFYDEFRKSNKIAARADQFNEISIGTSHASNILGAQARYFLTRQDALDLGFSYDYSRAREAISFQIARVYQTRLTYHHAFGRRFVMRGYWIFDYLRRPSRSDLESTKAILSTYRNEPGLGATFTLGKRVSVDLDYGRQFILERDPHETSEGNHVTFRMNHQLTKRLAHSYAFGYSKLEPKRSAISTISSTSPGNFEALTAGTQFSYDVTRLTKLRVTLEYAWTDAGLPDSETNNRKRISVELARPVFKTRATVWARYIFEKNNGAIPASYHSNTFIMGISTTFGGRVGE